MHIEKNKLSGLIIMVITPFSAILYCVLFLLLNNIDETNIQDIIAPFCISIGITAIVLFFTCFFTHDLYTGGFIATLIYITCLNYKFLQDFIVKISYRFRYWHIMPCFIFALIVFFFLVYRYMNHDIVKIIDQVLIFVFSFLTLSNVVMNFGGIVRKLNVYEEPSNSYTENEFTLTGQPNVYFIILDEYSNFKTINKYYNYDNQEFYEFLIDKKFNVSLHSQNEIMNQLTMSITTNYLNLDYVAFDSDPLPNTIKLRKNPMLFRIFNEMGYEINFYGEYLEWNGQTGGGNGTTSQATTRDGKNFKDVFFANNLFYPFFEKDNTFDRQKWYDEYEFLLNNITESNQSKFVFVHTEGGHEPFVFTENGGTVPASERENLIDPQYYLGQYKFVTNQIEIAITRIIENDPESIIILMSDHSMRSTKNSKGETIVTQEDKTNIFNAVYFCGERVDEIIDQSGVNTLRLVLDKLFGSCLGKIEVPVK